MLQTCPACHSENRDIAKFCDSCGAPLSPEVERPVAQSGSARRKSGANWTALVWLAVIVLAIVWVIRTPSQQSATPPMAGGAAGGGANPIGTMEGVQKQLAGLKAKLKKDPLDVATLSDLYALYGQSGQTDKMAPYMDEAVKSWKRKYPNPDEDARKLLAGLALAALQANDDKAAVDVLIVYHEADPDNLGVIATIGNIYYEMNEPAKAVEYYDMYLARTKPAEQGDDYWNILVDKATMHLNLAGDDLKSKDYTTALELLQRATREAPKHWAAWYNLGQAHEMAGEKDKALAALKKSLEVAGDAESKYEAQKEINKLEGKPAPEPPANPHEGMDMSGQGMNLPKPPPGTPNPHTGGGGM